MKIANRATAARFSASELLIEPWTCSDRRESLFKTTFLLLVAMVVESSNWAVARRG
jgi:hypothetical protein